MPRVPKLQTSSLAVRIGVERGTTLKAMEDELDARDNRRVRCYSCGYQQRDEGVRATCCRCGCSPMPSYEYSPACFFYPKRRETQQQRIEEQLKKRRTEERDGK
jgi:hypothetical protein